MNRSYLQDFFSDLVETLPNHLSLELQSTFPGASNCYNLNRSLPALEILPLLETEQDPDYSIVLQPGGHYSIVRFGVGRGEDHQDHFEVSLCVLENGKHKGGHLITGVDLTALSVCQCNRTDHNYLHLFCDPYEPEYPLIDFPEIPSIN